MKIKNLLITLLFASSVPASAQVPNGDFESLNFDGTLSNWGNVYLMSVTIDTTGNPVYDSIVWSNNYYYTPTFDAHSGNVAMELNNSMNYTTGQCITGSASADTDTVFSAWGSLEFINTQLQPGDLSFWYKYLPAGYDSAQATLIVYDSALNEVGSAMITIGGTVSNYTLAYVPIVYTAPGPVAFYSLNFRATSYTQTPTFGTRFIVDDVTMSSMTRIEKMSLTPEFILFPNPASDMITIKNITRKMSYRIFSGFGVEVSTGTVLPGNPIIPLDALMPGVYFIDFPGEENSSRQKLIIRK